MHIDPRYLQILILSLLNLYFNVSGALIALGLVVLTVSVQLILCKINERIFEWKSSAITALSISFLLKSSNILVYIAAVMIAIASKFIFRVNNKHIFNPANLGIVTMLLAVEDSWLVPSQLNSSEFVVVFAMMIGMVLLSKIKRLEVPLCFLLCYFLLIEVWALYLGDPQSIPIHQIQTGSLIVFAFFMISDPMTTPNHYLGRILFTLLVALMAFCLQFLLYIPEGVIYSLALCSLLVPMIDGIFSSKKFYWGQKLKTSIR